MRTKGSSFPFGSLSCSKIVEIRDVAGWERLSLNPVRNGGSGPIKEVQRYSLNGNRIIELYGYNSSYNNYNES